MGGSEQLYANISHIHELVTEVPLISEIAWQYCRVNPANDS